MELIFRDMLPGEELPTLTHAIIALAPTGYIVLGLFTGGAFFISASAGRRSSALYSVIAFVGVILAIIAFGLFFPVYALTRAAI